MLRQKNGVQGSTYPSMVMAFHDGSPARRWIFLWPGGSLKSGFGRLCSTRSWTSNDQLVRFCIPATWYDPTTVARFDGPKHTDRTPTLRFLALEARPPFATPVLRQPWQCCRWRSSSPRRPLHGVRSEVRSLDIWVLVHSVSRDACVAIPLHPMTCRLSSTLWISGEPRTDRRLHTCGMDRPDALGLT